MYSVHPDVDNFHGTERRCDEIQLGENTSIGENIAIGLNMGKNGKKKRKDKRLKLVRQAFENKVPEGLNFGVADNLRPQDIASVTGMDINQVNQMYETDSNDSKDIILRKARHISDDINITNIDKKYLFPNSVLNSGNFSDFHIRLWMFEFNQLSPHERREVSDTIELWKKTKKNPKDDTPKVTEEKENLYPDIQDSGYQDYINNPEIQRTKGALMKSGSGDLGEEEETRPFSPLQNMMINKIYQAEDEINVVEDQIAQANEYLKSILQDKQVSKEEKETHRLIFDLLNDKVKLLNKQRKEARKVSLQESQANLEVADIGLDQSRFLDSIRHVVFDEVSRILENGSNNSFEDAKTGESEDGSFVSTHTRGHVGRAVGQSHVTQAGSAPNTSRVRSNSKVNDTRKPTSKNSRGNGSRSRSAGRNQGQTEHTTHNTGNHYRMAAGGRGPPGDDDSDTDDEDHDHRDPRGSRGGGDPDRRPGGGPGPGGDGGGPGRGQGPPGSRGHDSHHRRPGAGPPGGGGDDPEDNDDDNMSQATSASAFGLNRVDSLMHRVDESIRRCQQALSQHRDVKNILQIAAREAERTCNFYQDEKAKITQISPQNEEYLSEKLNTLYDLMLEVTVRISEIEQEQEASRRGPREQIPKFHGDAIEYTQFEIEFKQATKNYLTENNKVTALKASLSGELRNEMVETISLCRTLQECFDALNYKYAEFYSQLPKQKSILKALKGTPAEHDYETEIKNILKIMRFCRWLKVNQKSHTFGDARAIILQKLRASKAEEIVRSKLQTLEEIEEYLNELLGDDQILQEQVIEARAASGHQGAAVGRGGHHYGGGGRGTGRGGGRGGFPTSHAHQTGAQPSSGGCDYCGGNHYKYSCPELRAITNVKDLREKLKSAGLCFKCLQTYAGHTCETSYFSKKLNKWMSKVCQRDGCKYGVHNSICPCFHTRRTGGSAGGLRGGQGGPAVSGGGGVH